MPHLFGCPCGQQFAVRPETLGQNVRCPHCSRVLHVPTPASPPPPAAAPVLTRSETVPQPEATVPQPMPRVAQTFGAVAAVVLVLATGAGVLLYQHVQTTPDDPPAPHVRNDNDPPTMPDPPRKADQPAKQAPERPR